MRYLLLSEPGFHFTLTNPVADSCAGGNSADPLGNASVRHRRWASCLANATLAISGAFYRVHKTKLSAVSKQTLLVSTVTRICNYHTWIHHCHKCEKYCWVKGFFGSCWGNKTKRGKGFVLLICISIPKKIALTKLHCVSFLEVCLTCREKENKLFC